MKTIVRVLAFLCLAFLLGAQVLLVTLADVSGDSAAHAVATVGTARWVQFVAPSTNSSVVRVGDSNVGTSRGTPIAPGGGFMLPVNQGLPGYDLSKTYYFVATGDKVSITWAK